MSCEDNYEEFTAIWQIENFSFCCEDTGHCLVSETFLVKSFENMGWYMALYPRGSVDSDYIECEIITTADEIVYFELALLDHTGSPGFCSVAKTECTEYSNEALFRRFVPRNVIFNGTTQLLPNDILTLICRIRKSGDFLDGIQRIDCVTKMRIPVDKFSIGLRIEDFDELYPGQKQIFNLLPHSNRYPAATLVLHMTEESGNMESMQIEILFGRPMLDSHFCKCIIYLLNTAGKTMDLTQSEYFLSRQLNKRDKWTFSISTTIAQLMANKDLYLKEGVLNLYCEFAISTSEVFEEVEYINYVISTVEDMKSIVNSTAAREKICPQLKTFCQSRPQINMPNQLEACGASTIKDTQSTDNPMATESNRCIRMEEMCSNETIVDLLSMYEDGLFSDFNLKVGTVIFPVHRYILSARSAIFKERLEGYAKEPANKTMEICDVESDTLKRMLHFLYSDEVKDIQWEIACRLYCTANIYKVELLKQTCSAFIKSNLCVLNIFEALILSDKYLDNELLESAVELICTQNISIEKYSEWKEFAENNSGTAYKLPLLIRLRKKIDN